METTLAPAPACLVDIFDPRFPERTLDRNQKRSVNSWRARLDDAGTWLLTRAVIPDPYAEDDIERSLGRWVAKQRLDLRSRKLSPTQIMDLDAAVHGWRIHSLEARWRRNHAVLAEQYKTHGYYLGESTNQKTAEWATRQGDCIPTLGTPGRIAAIDKLTPGLTGGIAESKWVHNSLEVGAFHAEHGRLPSRKTGGDDERHLGLWLHNQRLRLKGQTATARARETALSAIVPTWRGSQRRTSVAA